MQCTKCNSFIPEGYLYCPVCGNEVIIVSDFDINLENNIDMAAIVDTVELPDVTKTILPDEFAVTRDLTVDKKSLVKDNDINNRNEKTIVQNRTKKDNSRKVNKRTNILKILSVIFIILLIVGGIIAVITVNISRYYSYDYQYQKALDYVADNEYDDAISTCKHLISLDGDKKGKMLLADCYMAQNNYDAAIAVLYGALDDYPDDMSIYDMIVRCYEIQGDNKGINELIANNSDSTLALRYSDYVSFAPQFSLESGSYVEPDPIKLTAIGEGVIYYTVDGSVPNEESLVYMGPIPLEPGENTISAIFINDKGLASEVVSYNYYVELNIPDDPVLLVNSGTKNMPELIGIKTEDNVKYYYTEGNATPTNESKEYTVPFLMPIGKSSFSFVAYNENGEHSSVIVAEYNLTLNSSILQSVAEYAISYQLLSKGENVIANTYKTNYGYSDNSRVFYVIEEYSLDKLTGRRFAVDINTGELFSLLTNPDGSFSTLPL